MRCANLLFLGSQEPNKFGNVVMRVTDTGDKVAYPLGRSREHSRTQTSGAELYAADAVIEAEFPILYL
jgi:hypothetical protein